MSEPKVSETLQEYMRSRLKKQLGIESCPTCGHSPSGYREAARVTSVPVASLHRFLSGKNADGKTLDAIHAFLTEPAPKAGKGEK